MKKTLYHISLLVLCYACAEPVERPTTDATLTISQEQSSFLFAGLPVLFGVNTEERNTSVSEWVFGDGNTTSEVGPSHTFDFPGTYRASVLLNNRQISIDSTFTVSPPLKLFGSKVTTEIGRFLFERPGGGYAMVYTSENDWKVLYTTSTFDTLVSRKLPVDLYDDVFDVIQNKNGNIVVLDEMHMFEVNRNGNVVKTIFPTNNTRTPTRITETANGYLAASWAFSGLLNIATLNYNFEKLSEVNLDITRPGFGLSEFYLEPTGTLRIHYYQALGIENPPRLLVRMDFEGNILLEQNYTPDVAVATRSFTLSSGYMLYGGTVENMVFTRATDTGNPLWKITYRGNNSESGVSFFEDGSSIIVFFGFQTGVKINESGQVVWTKKFGLNADTFNGAIRNSRGNIVLLGTHQFDYINYQFTNEYAKRDLLLLETDMDGNLVP